MPYQPASTYPLQRGRLPTPSSTDIITEVPKKTTTTPCTLHVKEDCSGADTRPQAMDERSNVRGNVTANTFETSPLLLLPPGGGGGKGQENKTTILQKALHNPSAPSHHKDAGVYQVSWNL